MTSTVGVTPNRRVALPRPHSPQAGDRRIVPSGIAGMMACRAAYQCRQPFQLALGAIQLMLGRRPGVKRTREVFPRRVGFGSRIPRLREGGQPPARRHSWQSRRCAPVWASSTRRVESHPCVGLMPFRTGKRCRQNPDPPPRRTARPEQFGFRQCGGAEGIGFPGGRDSQARAARGMALSFPPPDRSIRRRAKRPADCPASVPAPARRWSVPCISAPE